MFNFFILKLMIYTRDETNASMPTESMLVHIKVTVVTDCRDEHLKINIYSDDKNIENLVSRRIGNA